jgi:hypothetical protein
MATFNGSRFDDPQSFLNCSGVGTSTSQPSPYLSPALQQGHRTTCLLSHQATES